MIEMGMAQQWIGPVESASLWGGTLLASFSLSIGLRVLISVLAGLSTQNNQIYGLSAFCRSNHIAFATERKRGGHLRSSNGEAEIPVK